MEEIEAEVTTVFTPIDYEDEIFFFSWLYIYIGGFYLLCDKGNGTTGSHVIYSFFFFYFVLIKLFTKY